MGVTAAASAMAEEAPASYTFADTVDWAAEYDVVVLGMGFSGMVSAMEAADAGASVLICEKCAEGEAGGNSRVCGQMFAYGFDDPDNALTIEERYVQPYYVSYDRAETGYHDFPEAEGLASLLHNMPLGGLGSCFSDAVQPGGSHKPESDNAPAVGDAPVGAGFAGGIKWCRTVPVRFAHLIPGLPDHLEVVGGTRCVCLTTFNEDIFAPNSGAEAERVARYLAERSLEVAGRAFCPISLPSDHGFYMLFCVPVR